MGLVCLTSLLILEFVCPVWAKPSAKLMLRKLDFIFVLQHPTPLNASPVKRETALGGLFTVLCCVLSVLIVSFLISRYYTDRYQMNQTTTPGLSELKYGHIVFTLQLIGSDSHSSQLCTAAVACQQLTVAVAGECTAALIATPGTQNGGLSTVCQVTFVPSNPELPLPSDFTLTFGFPFTRAQAVRWAVSSSFSPTHSYGVEESLLPPAGAVLYGPATLPTLVNVLVRPAILEHADLLFSDSSLDRDTPLYGYLPCRLNATLISSTVNASNYFTGGVAVTHGSKLPLALSALNSSLFLADAVPGVYVTLLVTRDTSLTHFSVGPKDPSGVELLSQMSALLSGMMVVLRLLLEVVEGLHIRWKRARKQPPSPTNSLSAIPLQLRAATLPLLASDSSLQPSDSAALTPPSS
jgi:hypothetical protein